MKAILGAGALALAGAAGLAFAPDIPARLTRLPRTTIDCDYTLLDAREGTVLVELIAASRPLGDYARAQKLLDGYGKLTPEMARINAGLTDIPVDIAPVYAAAGEK